MSAISQVVNLVAQRLGRYLQEFDGAPALSVAVADLLDGNGQPNPAVANRLVVSLVGISQEILLSTAGSPASQRVNQGRSGGPPVFVNLQLLFYANFRGEDYQQGLRAISHTIGFFQLYPVFTRDMIPELMPGIDRLAFEMARLDASQLHHVIAMMGARYLPSIIYQVRSIPIWHQSDRSERHWEQMAG